MRFSLVLLAALAASCRTSGASPDRPVQLSMDCAIDLPLGWLRSPSPMPDHVLEARTTDSSPSVLVVREALEPTVLTATAAAKERTEAAWGGQPNFALVDERSLGDGVVLAYRWRPSPGAAPRRHTIGLLPFGKTIALAIADEDDGATANPIVSALHSLRCRSR